MKQILIIIIVLSCFLGTSYAQFFTLDEAALSLKTPMQISQWLRSDFEYIWQLPYPKQDPEVTLRLRKGSCLDFALLTQALLKKQGIESSIIILKFKGIDTAHALCVFQEAGRYAFMSNRQLVRTQAKSLEEAITSQYPDWEKISYADRDLKFARVVEREKHEN